MKRKKKKTKIRVNRLITLLLFVFILCFGIISFIKSDFFSLKNIKIVNNNILAKEEIKKLAKITTRKNLFTYDLKNIELNIEKSRYIKDAKIKRRIPNTIVIDIEEEPIICVLKDKDDNYYYIAENMYYIDKVEYKKIKNNSLVVEIDFTVKNNKINFRDNDEKNKLDLLMKNIEKERLDNKISSINFLENNEIRLKTKEGIEVIINKTGNIKHDMAKLTQILIDLKSRDINYGKIDMTFLKYALYTYK